MTTLRHADITQHARDMEHSEDFLLGTSAYVQDESLGILAVGLFFSWRKFERLWRKRCRLIESGKIDPFDNSGDGVVYVPLEPVFRRWEA